MARDSTRFRVRANQAPPSSRSAISANTGAMPSAAEMRAGGERDEGLAGVDHGGADAHRLALAAGRRRFVEQRHDHRLRRAEAQAEHEGERHQERHALDEGEEQVARRRRASWRS